MQTITNRDDIQKLVHAFYASVREDDLLGPIFNTFIAEDQWPVHLKKLTDFWETNLFRIPKFKGNPTLKHIEVDKEEHYSIEPKHFERWLFLWRQTIDTYFEGECAEYAKLSARRMAASQFSMIQKNRPN
jgi:hemoglobin